DGPSRGGETEDRGGHSAAPFFLLFGQIPRRFAPRNDRGAQPLSALFRRLWSRIRLRTRIADGVTSTSSSSLIHSIACSIVSNLGWFSRTAMSAVEARMFVSCLRLQGWTTRSLSLTCSPTIWPP